MRRLLFFLELILILLAASIALVVSKDNISVEKNTSCLSFTFDDGLESHYTNVYPILKEKNFSATFFVIANITSDLDELNRNLIKNYQVKELIENGFEIGSHTLTHALLTELNEEKVERELKESKEILEKTYNITMNSFAFPYSRYNYNILSVAKKYYNIIRDETFQIYSFGLRSDSNIKEMCNNIYDAKRKNLHIALIFHDIIELPKIWDTSITDFRDILECAEKSSIRIDSLRGCKNGTHDN